MGSKAHSIVISGESGAGKTESCRLIVDYLVKRTGNSTGAIDTETSSKMVSSTCILDAFGNAKTIRNDNSSRFGKNIALGLKMGGCRVETLVISSYLLERTRICFQEKNERNASHF